MFSQKGHFPKPACRCSIRDRLVGLLTLINNLVLFRSLQGDSFLRTSQWRTNMADTTTTSVYHGDSKFIAKQIGDNRIPESRTTKDSTIFGSVTQDTSNNFSNSSVTENITDLLANLTIGNQTLGYPQYYSPLYKTIGCFFVSVIFIVGLFGNVMVVTVVWRTKSMHTTTNCHLVSLAFADIILLISAPLPTIAEYFLIVDQSIFGAVGCSLMVFFQYLGVNLSSLSITAFSVERWENPNTYASIELNSVTVCGKFYSFVLSIKCLESWHLEALKLMLFATTVLLNLISAWNCAGRY